MAVKTFTVVFNRYPLQGLIGEGTKQLLTGAQAQARHKKLKKEPVSVIGPVEIAKLVQIVAEDAEAAATAVRLLLGASASEGELEVIETSLLEKKDSS